VSAHRAHAGSASPRRLGPPTSRSCLLRSLARGAFFSCLFLKWYAPFVCLCLGLILIQVLAVL
jgi:hypothetical protein